MPVEDISIYIIHFGNIHSLIQDSSMWILLNDFIYLGLNWRLKFTIECSAVVITRTSQIKLHSHNITLSFTKIMKRHDFLVCSMDET